MGEYSLTQAIAEADEIARVSCLAGDTLPSLPVYSSVAAAERFLDRIATRLGLPFRLESSWAISPRAREVKYTNNRGLELSVRISPGGMLEGKPCVLFSGTARRIAPPRSAQIPLRLRPAAFQKDLSEILARLRRGN